jgi:flagellar hook-associated protein 2
MSTGLQVAGLASNFDWKSFVDQIMALEHAPADRLAAEKVTNTQKVTLLSSLGTKLASLQTSIKALKSDSLFGKRSALSLTSNSSWAVFAGTDTAIGSYKIAVSQLATSASLKGATDVGSALNPTSDDVAGLTLANLPLGQAVSAGTFSINGHQVTVALTDSLLDVFNAISTATSGDVTGSYDHTTDTITLTSATGNVMLGAANDTTNFLRALKLGNNGTGTVTSSARLGAVKTSATLVNANLGTAITAIDGTGAGTFSINGVDFAYNVNSDTLSSVIARINQSTAGVAASYDALNDRLVLANKSTGDLGISVTESSGGLLGALGLTSGTTFTRGNNAQFTIDGGDILTSASNTLDDTSHGISGLSVTANSLETQTITVAPDTSAMRAKIEAFIKDYNEVQQFIDSNTKVSTDAKGKVTAATLSSNREIQDWARSLRTMAFAAVSGLTGSVKRLNDLGLDFKSGTNELEIDDDAKLNAALTESTTDVEAFFTTASTGFSAKLDTFLEKISDQNSDQQERINKTNTNLDEQIAAIERRLEQQRAVMESAFIQMETAQSKIKQQQSALDGMIAQQTSK